LNKTYSTVGAAALATLVVLPAQAADWTDRVTVSGFASANYFRTDDPASFNDQAGQGHDDQGSFSGTRVGINIRAKINDKFRFASQLFSVKQEDNYSVHLDWGFGTLQLSENVDFSAGKLKFPIGLVNEYVDVGYAYPWLVAPQSLYSRLGAPNGPQVTREAYTGANLLWTIPYEDWTYDVNLFGGEVNLEGTNVRQLGGIVLKADWDDQLLIKLSSYQGTMRNVDIEDNPAMSAAMEDQKHRVNSFGIKADINNYLAIFEISNVKMGDLSAMKATTWYSTFGYQLGEFLPHLTYQQYKQGDPVEDDQTTVTLGLRWDILKDVAAKFEISQIKLDSGLGLFAEQPEDDTVTMLGIGIDTVF